jgi:hypothetical protein
VARGRIFLTWITASPSSPGHGKGPPLEGMGPMKKIIALATLAFAVAAGAVTVETVHPHLAMMTCGNPNC